MLTNNHTYIFPFVFFRRVYRNKNICICENTDLFPTFSRIGVRHDTTKSRHVSFLFACPVYWKQLPS